MRGAHAATGAGAPGNVSAWLRAHALVSMALVLLVSAVLAARGLVGSGLLHGGALPPAPDRASDWWRLYEQSEHPVALGSSLVTAPYVVALGIAAFVLLGKAWLAVDVVMLLCVPLAAVGAYAAARRLISGSASRIWVAVSYALVPVLTGSVTTGHVGTVAALVVLPWLVCAARPLWVGGAVDGARAMAATGLVLALLAALTPVAYPMAAALLAIVAPLVAWQRRARTLALSVGALVLPVILLAPWSIRLITDPRLLLTEAGAVDPSTPSVSDVAWQLPFGRLGVGGAAPWWVSAGVVAAALVAVARPDRRGRVVLCWLVAALSLATAAVMAELVVVVPGAGVSAFAWLGFPVAVAQAAAILAVGLASDGLRSSLASGPFGVRQPFVAVVGLAALLSPAAGLVWWVTAASQGELSRHQTSVLPAYLTDELVSDTGRRALVLRRDGGRVTYQVVVGDGFRLGDDSVLPVGEPAQVTAVVGNLLSQPRPADVRRLGRLGVSYLLLPAPAEPADVVALDGLAGLTRASTDLAVVDGWRVVAGDQASSEVVGPPASASSGQPTVLSAHRPWWLAGQAAAWLVALVLAAPGLERRAGIARSHA